MVAVPTYAFAELELTRPTRAWRQAWLCVDLDDWPADTGYAQW